MIIYAGINPRALAFLPEKTKRREKRAGKLGERKGVGVGLASRWMVRGPSK